jgi:hypothetical protein
MIIYPLDGNVGYYGTLTTITSAQSFPTAAIQPTSGLATGLTAQSALVTIETAAINFTIDGTTPTIAAGTNVGHTADSGSSFTLKGLNNIKNFQCINRVNASGAVVKYSISF